MIKPNFSEDKGTLLLSLTEEEVSISEKMYDFAADREFSLKEEFHVTLVGFKIGERVKKKIIDPAIKESLLAIVEKTQWQIKPGFEFFQIQKDYKFDNNDEHREAIIQMIDMPSIEKFYEEISALLRVKIEKPPLHISLFTKGNPIGIGINTQKDFENMRSVKLSF